jgi:signal recognition particle receptor subunit beta
MLKSISKFISPRNMTTTNSNKKRESHSVLMAGLDAVGKIQLICRLKYGKSVFTSPSYDIDMVTTTVHDTITGITADFSVTALPGYWVQRGFTPLYFQQLLQQRQPLPAAIIFVVDSVRPDTLDDAKQTLWSICEAYEGLVRGEQPGSLVLLVFANKQDVNGAMSIPVIKDYLDLERRASVNMRWHIRGTETCFGSGIQEGLIWLDTQLSASSSVKTTSSSASTAMSVTSMTKE